MVASIARIEANRRNSLKSTGPRTAEGKERSRANALKHGFAAVVCRTELDEKAAEDWARRCPEAAGSSVLDARWLAEEVAVITDRIERIGRIDYRNRERAVLRAMTCWDDDRKREAESLGAALTRNPSQVARLLEETTQGCEWLIRRWAMLARVADLDGGWDPAGRSLAFDLLGTPHPLRKGEPGTPIDTQGRTLGEPCKPADLARSQVERLTAHLDEIAHLDDFDRDSACAGLDSAMGIVERRLRNYESALHRRLRWYVDQLAGGTPGSPAGLPEPPPAEAEAVDVSPEATAEPEPDPIEDPPASPHSRHERKARKVEKRRAAAQRKLLRRLGEPSGPLQAEPTLPIGPIELAPSP